MMVMTKHFGEVDLDEDKIINFEKGILGFEDYKRYTLLYNTVEGERPNISWLQSLDEPALSIPVMNPFLLKEDYNPQIEDELLKSLGKLTEDNLVILVSITVPNVVENMTANLKAPFILNSDTKKAIQIIAQNSDYPVKYPFYQKLQELKMEKGGE
jgi:flagellar assembly factor FliW